LKQGHDLSRLHEEVGFGADELFDNNQEESMPVIPPFFPDDLEDNTNQSPPLPGQ
jgi:hypothetical protein